MSASDHLSKPLFHGTTFRYGHLKRGDIIKPAKDIEVPTNHDASEYPEAANWAHATPSVRWAYNYADWTANGATEANMEDFGKNRAPFKPHVFQVEPVGRVETDPEHPTGIRAEGLRVVRRVLPDEDLDDMTP